MKPRKALFGKLEPFEIPRSYCGDVERLAIGRISLQQIFGNLEAAPKVSRLQCLLRGTQLLFP
jgi:hypothetical protein